MKRLALLAATLFCPALLFAEMKPMEGLGSIPNAFIVKGRADELTLESGEETVIRYTPSVGQSNVLLLGHGKEAMEIDVKEISVDFLLHGYGSIGIYAQGGSAEEGSDGYLALANAERNNEGQLRIIRNAIWPQAYPQPEQIKSKQVLRNYRAATWYRLTLLVDEKEGEEVLVTARLSDLADGSTVSEIQYSDEHGLRGARQMALRVFVEKGNDSFVEFKNLVITPRE